LTVSPESSQNKRVVIVGAGLGGLRTTESLRSSGFAGHIALVGAESTVPYDRPPLSKQVLTGDWPPERTALISDDNLTKLSLELLPGRAAVGLDAANRAVRLDDGQTLSGDAIVVATGAHARRFPNSDELPNTFVVRTLADSLAVRAAFATARRVAVIGAGFIGAEIAAAARKAGLDVTVLEALPVPLQRQLGDAMGAACGSLHERHGTRLRTGVDVSGIDRTGVHLRSGDHVPADVVVVGIGAVPDVGWMNESAVRIDTTMGVYCDDHCRAQLRASDGFPDGFSDALPVGSPGPPAEGIYAVGDVASWPNARYGGERMRIEHWTNAAEMASHASDSVLHQFGLGADPGPYTPLPYFWSDQYDAKIQFLGRITGFEEVCVVSGSVGEGSWLALYRRGDRVVAALGVTKMRLLMRTRKLLMENAAWDDAVALATAG
jgi:NADPH-dependent 2,4-dienoyl-CoA reductase/sulfur reductase-like enzyme